MRSSIPALVQKYSFYNEYYDFSNYNTDYLLKENYDAKWHQLIQSASGLYCRLRCISSFCEKPSEHHQ